VVLVYTTILQARVVLLLLVALQTQGRLLQELLLLTHLLEQAAQTLTTNPTLLYICGSAQYDFHYLESKRLIWQN